MGRRILNTLAAIIIRSDIEFSSRYNGLYGMNEFLAILTEMCRSGITAAEAVRNIEDHMKVPTPRWFHDRVRTVSLEGVRWICERMMAETVAAAKEGVLHAAAPSWLQSTST